MDYEQLAEALERAVTELEAILARSTTGMKPDSPMAFEDLFCPECDGMFDTHEPTCSLKTHQQHLL